MPSRSPLSNGRTRRHRRANPYVVLALVIFMIALCFGIPAGIYLATKDTVKITVTDKNIKYVRDSNEGHSGHDVYMIYTDKGTFKDVDTIFAWKWNSSDLYGKLKVGQTYTCTVSGFRIGFTSSYKNLVSCN